MLTVLVLVYPSSHSHLYDPTRLKHFELAGHVRVLL